MYLYLMDDIAALDLEDIQVISSLENLINTAYAGYNIIDAKKSTFRFLLNCDKFGNATLQKIKQIIEFNNEYYSLFNEITYKFTVSATIHSFFKNGDNWIIPLSCFTYGNLAGLELLAEDEGDAKLLIHAMHHHQNLNPNLRNFKINAIPSNGGGANIKNIVATKIADQNKFLVCFCDSDKNSDLSELGAVTKECKEKSDQAEFPCYFFNTEGREIENDLPFYFINEVINFQNNPEVKNAFLKIIEINDIDSDIIKFSDYKDGITYKYIQSIKCQESTKFWNNSIEKLENLKLINKPKIDEDIIVQHLSKNIASNVLDWLDFKLVIKPKKVHEIIKNESNAQAWLNHGRNLFWLASGMKKGRI